MDLSAEELENWGPPRPNGAVNMWARKAFDE
jgi:hypothetical protein